MKRCKRHKDLDESTIRELAVKAGVDPRTIEKAARGEPVRGMAGHRARAALREAGILPASQMDVITNTEGNIVGEFKRHHG